MISANDSTILAMLSRYPNMSHREADNYLDKLEDWECRQVAMAIAGRIGREDLTEENQAVYDEFRSWSDDRTRRFLAEQVEARRRRKETKVAKQLIKMRDQGLVNDEVLMLYGISGPLPERRTYAEMTRTEQNALWTNRMTQRFGSGWREVFSHPPIFVEETPVENTNWRKEGF